MKKKGFTLVELLAVIAILAILVIMALPAVLRMFNQARKDSFTNEVNTIIRTARQQYLLSGGEAQSWSNAEGSANKLDLTGNSNLKYYASMNGNGQITELQVTNGDFQYSHIGIVDMIDSSAVQSVSELAESDILVIDGNSNAVDYLCKRATVLHTEQCTQTSTSGYYCSSAGFYGKTITYGNLGTSGTLTPGDAFDCDVNNDGTYDSDTERFYYVSPKDSDTSSNYVTLIYYNNVSNGLPDNLAKYAYSTMDACSYITTDEFCGPNTGYLHLPSTSQWTNAHLSSNMVRQIKNKSGLTSVYYDDEYYSLPVFIYTDRAARLLTYPELVYACGSGTTSTNGYLDSCNYLMENTQYSSGSLGTTGFWLETWSTTNPYVITTFSRRNTTTNSFSSDIREGIRPAIEVNKNYIEY